MRFILNFITKIFSTIYSYETSTRLRKYTNKLYSYWIQSSMKNHAKGFFVARPANFKGFQYMSFGDGFYSGDRLRIECWDEFGGNKFKPKLVIGNNVIMNNNVHIGCINHIQIGNNVLFASNIFITDHQHGYVDKRDFGIAPAKRSLNSSGPVIIEDNVWIGENVSIMPNVTIGEGCIIGANSVVTKSFTKNTVLAGVPAKFIKSLNIK